jgi:hypothetical protein
MMSRRRSRNAHTQPPCKPRGGHGGVTGKTCRAGLEDDFTDADRDPLAAVARSVGDPRAGLLTAADRAVLACRRERFEARRGAEASPEFAPDATN